LREFGEQVSGLTLVPGEEGHFEVVINGDLVYSKMRTGRFPATTEVRSALVKRLASPSS